MPDPTIIITLTVPARWADLVRSTLVLEARVMARTTETLSEIVRNAKNAATMREQAAVMRDVARQLGGGDGE